MHNAPSVSFPVGRSRFQALASTWIWLAAAAFCAYWCYQVDVVGWRQWLVWATLCSVGAVAARAWYVSPPGVLRWDGQFWWWETSGASVSGALTVHLDFQTCLLLSLRNDAGLQHWFWPERRNGPASWDALRRAAYARANASSRQGPASQVNPDEATS